MRKATTILYEYFCDILEKNIQIIQDLIETLYLLIIKDNIISKKQYTQLNLFSERLIGSEVPSCFKYILKIRLTWKNH